MFKNNYDAVEFGKRLKMARKKAGMTQEKLAEELILSVDSISRIENGKVMCMAEHLVHICEILNVTSDYLYFGSEEIINKYSNTKSNICNTLEKCNNSEIDKIWKIINLVMSN